MPKLTEIIPDNIPEWAKDLMAEGQLFNGMFEKLKRLQSLVDSQAEDDGLWFDAETASEAYLQQELRTLHELIDGEFGP